jgi:hypothetical protein
VGEPKSLWLSPSESAGVDRSTAVIVRRKPEASGGLNKRRRRDRERAREKRSRRRARRDAVIHPLPPGSASTVATKHFPSSFHFPSGKPSSERSPRPSIAASAARPYTRPDLRGDDSSCIRYRQSVLPYYCAAVNVVCGSPHRTHRTCVQSKHTAPRMSTFQLPHTQGTAPASQGLSSSRHSSSILASTPVMEQAGS